MSKTSGENNSSNTQNKRKLVIVGDGASGKTSLMFVYTNGVFPEAYVPTVFENYTSSVAVDNQKVNITFWDTAGQEGYDRLRPLAYPDTDIILIAFGIDNPDSLENVTAKWVPEVIHFCHGTPVILVGCKKDLRSDAKTIEELARNGLQPVTIDQGRHIAHQIAAIRYLECSAKTGEGVARVFEESARGILQNKNRRKKGKGKGCLVL